MAGVGSDVGDGSAYRNVLPLIRRRLQRQLQHTVDGEAHLGVPLDPREVIEVRTSTTGDDLPDPCCVGLTVDIYLGKALVQMVVTIDDEVHLIAVEQSPQVAHRNVRSVRA